MNYPRIKIPWQFVSLAVCVVTTTLSAADWPSWRGPDGSGVGVGPGKPLVDDLADMKLVWRSEEREIPANTWHNGTQGGYDSPIVANGKVFLNYFKGTGDILDAAVLKDGDSRKAGPERAKWNAAVATEDVVLCVDAKTGKTLWRKVLAEGVNLYQRRKGGPHQGVCWSDGKVYAQSTLGRVYCLNDTDGSIIWQADHPLTPKQLNVLETYKRTGQQHPYRGIEPAEFNKCGTPKTFMLPLSVAGGVVVADGIALDAATGKPVAWPKPPTSGRSGSVRWVSGGQEFFIIGNTCYEPRTGKVVWRIKEASGNHSPAVSGSNIVLTAEGFVGCRIDAKGYAVLWTNKDYTTPLSSAGVINDGWFYAVVHTAGGRANMPPNTTELAIAIELATGKVVGPVGFGGITQSLQTSPVGMEGRWFFHVGAGYSGMVMMKMDPLDFRQVGLRIPTTKSIRELPGGTNAKAPLDYCLTSTPAMANGFMYIRGGDSLYCYDLRK